MGRYKKYIAILLMFSVYMMPFNARAAGMGGWTLSNPLAQGASTLYQGAKTVIINGKNVAKTSTALITPVAKDVSKVLVRGVAGVALSFAVEQLLGKVDWVLDPANNTIRYREQDKPANEDPTIPTIWSTQFKEDDYIYASAESAGRAACLHMNETFVRIWAFATWSANVQCKTNTGARDDWTVNAIPNPIYDPNAVPEENKEKSIPLDTVSAKVISNADAGNSDAKVATTSAVADIVNDAQKDDAKARPIVNQLEANSKTETDADANTATGSQTQNPTKPNTTDLSLEFPTFCGWAPQVCEAAQTVISFPQTLTNWWDTANSKADSWVKSVSEAWTAVKDWVKEPEKENTEIDIDNPAQTEPDTTISFSTACPAKIPLTFNWNGQTLDFSFDFSIWCESISTFVYPIVVALGSLHALYIVAGVRQDG
ncbi:virulence factor TspB C-terminal domain-related protein [Acinetobacter bereziniae]|uniref:virulence factor TspB C-terminal domain-related protein n=1 Tax=Acinetobacter bereziniae TaxID=106648 RepID=UPI0018FFD606|nr:virulence factor TspB C-terminal domain-related protein [Acinetobacter bereziniae]MBJ9905348.1 hypothetical protein [Acinetobacter bereziniae]MCU4321794.1 hypothetical protein [Acinetobacter bereziniae]MCU4601509.1 hypothetical protein [Acinetobacter bereziniae]